MVESQKLAFAANQSVSEIALPLAYESVALDNNRISQQALRDAIVASDLLQTFRGHTGALKSAIFSPDGQRILTASADKTARLFFVNLGDLLAIAACHISRSLTDEEIKYYQVPTPLKFDFAHRPPCATVLRK